ncbi:MAG TPA: glycosyltransferase family 4 protein [Burkholderiaceae bacterium]|jgi:glycosyltransferase involved in cell wall biosynthesis|nr:glycosyltransferase family 4 protein [Burkholderiaceae bacterium]
MSDSATNLRILVLTSTFPRWAGDREPPFVFELSRRLVNRFEVSVLAPHASNAKRQEIFGEISVHRFPYFFTGGQTLAYNGGILANLKRNRLNYLLVPFFMLFEFIYLWRLLRTTHIDVIHAHWLIPQGLVALLARACSGQSPLILCTSHGGDLFGLSGKLLTGIKRHIINRLDKFTVVSQAMRDYAYNLTARRDIEVIPMGVDLVRQFTPDSEPRSTCDILFVGRLVEKKGVRYLIEAMPEIIKAQPQATLLIAGEGPDKVMLEQLSVDIDVAPHVRFLGAVDNTLLQAQYRRAAIFVGPSIVAKGGDQEGLGLVFVEALGCECAVISSDLPAIKDVIIDGVTGLMCKQRDSADLANKVISLLDNPSLRQTLGQAGRRHVIERFDWEIVTHRYATLMQAMHH